MVLTQFLKNLLSITLLLVLAYSKAIPQVNADSVLVKSDTNSIVKEAPKSKFDFPVKYKARDSMRIDITEEIIYLYGAAEILYNEINLKADNIEFNIKENTCRAFGSKDSLGKLIGAPEFTEGTQTFKAKELLYNFDTKKGKIQEVVTQQGDGFILAQTLKKDPQDNYFIKDGRYTTCNQTDHPHFWINAQKLKVIPNDKIVTGPANLIIENVPTPLAVPFGFFPNSKGGRKSGVLLPFPGESAENGFFIKDGGYYWGINDYVDLTLKGDIYTKGSWGARALSNYVWKYHFSGNVNVGYSKFKFGEKDLSDYREQSDYFIRWTHNQDPKANPSGRFTANVNYGSSQYNFLNSRNTQDVLNNNFNSNVAYTKVWKGKYTLGVNARQSQSTLSKNVEGSLPSMNFNVTRFYPLQRKVQVGNAKWYENIGISYSNQIENRMVAPDTSFFKMETFRDAQRGLRHDIPVSTSVRFLKHFTFTPTFNYTERWYLQTLEKEFITTKKVGTDIDSSYIENRMIDRFNANRDFNVNAQFTTKLYGMFQFKSGSIKAIRHVITPTLGFNYIPQMYKLQTILNDTSIVSPRFYSTYEKAIYGGPNTVNQGNVTYSIINNLEMKVRSKKDTVSGFRKIKIFENLSASGFYNVFADSLNWSNVNINARTYLFEKLDINTNAVFDPYRVNKKTRTRINESFYSETGRPLRLSNANMALNWRLDNNKKQTERKSKLAKPDELAMINARPDAYVDFNVPWSLSINYNLQLNKPHQDTSIIVQTLGFNTDFNLTPKWKIAVNSGYDFINKKLSYTSVNIYRDLHCWEMRFNWVPFGFLRSYSIDINVKSSTLQDLKLSRRRSWYDLQ